MKRVKKFFGPFLMMRNNFDLFQQLLHREIEIKYKGSYLGILWNIITPVLMLLIYTFVFGVVFQAKWEYQLTDSKAEFAITLFAGIIMYNFFSEAANRAPSLISGNANYVKKVIFPLELLSLAHVCSLFVQMGVSIVIIVVGKGLLLQMWDLYFLLFPVVVVPLALFTVGLSWFFSAIGVFVKDMQQIVSIVVLILGYMTPVFYPLSFVPEEIRWVMNINPLTAIVDSGRRLLIYGELPEIGTYLCSLIISYVFMMLGYVFFRKVKSDFADVL